jgi:hypothetical protein
MAEEEELLDYSEDPMEGQLIWSGTGVHRLCVTQLLVSWSVGW